MKNFKRILAVVLVLSMVLSLAACGKKGGSDVVSQEPQIVDNGDVAATVKRTSDIVIGTWWVQHYDSNDTSLEDSGDYIVAVNDSNSDDPDTANTGKINLSVAQKKFDNVKVIENRYGLKFTWENLTYAGVRESINTSILAGTPDCDIYLTDASMAIPAQANGLTVDLKKILPADHDLFTDQNVMSYLDMGDGKASILMRQGGMTNSHPMAFNVQLLEDYNLEDPRDLWNRGEWTWDKFVEYAQILTQDTDGDGQTDQYGFGGYYPDMFEELMLSNGANIAAGTEQQLTSAKMTEVLQFVSDLYNVYNVCQPVNKEDDANLCRTAYRNGNIGFFMCDVWIQQTDGSDYDWDGSLGYTLPFDIAYCHWPVGYSGDQKNDPQLNNVGGELYILPAGVEDPLTVFNVLYDMWNWYNLDTTVRDDPATLNWWINATGRTDDYRQANFKIQQEIVNKQTVDIWNSMGVEFDLWGLASGEMTPAQFQETYKQSFQDALDALYK